MTTMKSMGAQIRQKRCAAGSNQTFIAKLLDRSQGWFSSVERDELPINEETFTKILAVIERVARATSFSVNCDDLRLPARLDFENRKMFVPREKAQRGRGHQAA
jgi:hypothetical protein